MRQSQWGTSHDYPYVYSRPARGRCVWSADGVSLAAGWWANIPASPPAKPDPTKPAEPPTTPEFPPDKKRPEIDDPPPDVIPVPVREPPSSPRPVALWLTGAA